MIYHSASTVQNLNSILADPENALPIGEIVDWACAGFNACLLAIGQVRA
jgi:hypothetical protein